MKIIFYLTLFFSVQFAKGQYLYCIKNTVVNPSTILFEFARMDVTNDSIVPLSLLPFNYYSSDFSSCFDYQSSIYYYSGPYTIHKIDAANGNFLRVDSFHIPMAERFRHIAFNPRDSCVYGIIHNLQNYMQWFARYSPNTGVLSKLFSITPIINIGYYCKSYINPFTGQYIIQSTNLTAIDIASGSIQYDYPIQNVMGEVFNQIAFSCAEQKLIGLSSNPQTEEKYLSSVDTITANVAHINSAPLSVSYYTHYLGGSTIDNNTGIFYYPAINGYLYGLDINTGSIVYSYNFGLGTELLFLESGSVFYCPLTGIEEHVESGLNIFPNPGSGKYYFSFDESDLPGEMKIYDLKGRCLKKVIVASNNFTLDISNFPDGIYLNSFKNKEKVVNGKLILSH